jgi:coenzyme F420-0:L-glutamate ligase/coenzyme F420-1:gamma-L-glutamate ligase
VAEEIGRDPRLVEVILRESRRVVRKDKGVLIVETHHGLVCANAGVDQSMSMPTPPVCSRGTPTLGPRVCATAWPPSPAIASASSSPTPSAGHGAKGLTNVAIGVAGLEPLKSYLGEKDPAGHVLQATILALADELSSAAEPIMGKLDRIPVVIIRGLNWPRGESGSRSLLRDPSRDLFARERTSCASGFSEARARKGRGWPSAGRSADTRSSSAHAMRSAPAPRRPSSPSSPETPP